ncbi:Protein FAR1-RELATED SEQUENCE 5 [Capsicum chinense]|nr:Protein FAR1-RELATED SEQUENCE 5 [Capsicum chinense]
MSVGLARGPTSLTEFGGLDSACHEIKRYQLADQRERLFEMAHDRKAYRLNQVEFVVDDHINGEEEEGTVVELRAVDENVIGGSSSEEALQQVHDVKVDEDLPEREDLLLEEAQCLDNSTSDEPYVGLEFESEAAAHAFYNAYATRVGFIIRVSKLSRSRRDGSAIGRALVCNKEGFRMPDKREKIVRQRAETRVGCRAMILVRKVNSGKWVVTKFVKEHSHPLCPGKGRRDLIYDQYPNEHDKIRELSQQLAAEKKRSATYKRHLEMIFEHIEEHNQSLSKKIQDIVHNDEKEELTAELRIKKRLTAACREQLLSLMKDVESHTEHLSTIKPFIPSCPLKGEPWSNW